MATPPAWCSGVGLVAGWRLRQDGHMGEAVRGRGEIGHQLGFR